MAPQGSPRGSRAASPPAARRDAWILLALALFAGCFLGAGIGSYGVVNADEAIYHAIAERMAETGDLLHLDFRGEPRVYDAFLNAPLHYWARALLIEAFGSSTATMRLLSVVFGVATVLATCVLGRRLAGRRAAVLAAGVQLTTYQFVYLHGARTGELEPIVCFLVTAAAIAFDRGVREGRSFVPFHLCLAGLVTTKAPLALVPLGAALSWLALRRDARPRLRPFAAAGLAVLPLALAWHGVQLAIHAERVPEILATMLGQAAGGRPDAPDVGLAGNARFYLGVLLHGAFPWSLAYPFAIAALWPPRAASSRRALAAWFAAWVLGFFLAVAKHYPWYVMPAYPFLSVLVGAWLADLTRRTSWRRAAWGVGAVLGGALWLSTGPLDANPFAERALTVPMETAARRLLGVGARIGIPACALAGAVLVWRARPGSRRGVAAARAGVALLGLLAAVRTTVPLVHLGYHSRFDRLRQEIEAAHAAGRLALPVAIRAPSVQIARFHFADDFELVPIRVGGVDGEIRIELHPAGSPAVLDRSIGRRGLERGFAGTSDADGP